MQRCLVSTADTRTLPQLSRDIRVCIRRLAEWTWTTLHNMSTRSPGHEWGKQEVQAWLQLDCEVVLHQDGLGAPEVVEEEDVGDVQLAEEEAVVRRPQLHAGVPREQGSPRHRHLLLLGGGSNMLRVIQVSLHRCQLQYCVVELFRMFPLWEINASWARKTWHGSLVQRREIITKS